jgi:hypothetical protein
VTFYAIYAIKEINAIYALYEFYALHFWEGVVSRIVLGAGWRVARPSVALFFEMGG